LVLAAIGLVAQKLNLPSLMKLYWYRTPDTMLSLVAALAVVHALRAWEARVPVSVGAAVGAIALVVSARRGMADRARAPHPPETPTWSWIRANTEPNAIFAVDPSWEWFYVAADRPMVVAFKNFPQHEPEVVEWFARLTASAGGRALSPGFAAIGEASTGWDGLTEPQLRDLSARYSATYAIVRASRPIGGLRRVYGDAQYQVLDLRAR
jgi:hypothetical protein